MIMVPTTTPPTIPPITPPERPFWAGDDELLPESLALADAELLLVAVGVRMPSVAVPVAAAEFPPPNEVAGTEEGATVPVIWTA